MKKTRKTHPGLKKIKDSFYKIHEKLYEMQVKRFDLVKNAASREDYYQAILEDINKEGLANCGEMANIAQHKLNDNGIKADVVRLLFHQYRRGQSRSNGVCDHIFTVINLDKNADLRKPETWGNEAIIIDPWLGIAKRANLALKQIKELMEYSPTTEYYELMPHNHEDRVQRQKVIYH